jgi:ferritin-like metal-binding protein YciE
VDTRTEALADTVRTKRVAIDNDLELLRVHLQQANPLRQDVMTHWVKTLSPVVAGAGTVWWWARRRRSVRSLDELLIHELRDLYATERRLVPALARMASRATNEELKQAFDHHQIETEGHIERLDRVFRSVNARARREKTTAVDSVIEQTERLLRRKVQPDVRDAWLIAAAQRVEHIEMAGYGTARTFAQTLGYAHAAHLLQQTLDEERNADASLTRLAERFVNPRCGYFFTKLK